MDCVKCGAAMKQTGKDTFSGREIREYACPRCGFEDFEDCGPALWQIMHDTREEEEAERRRAEAEQKKE